MSCHGRSSFIFSFLQSILSPVYPFITLLTHYKQQKCEIVCVQAICYLYFKVFAQACVSFSIKPSLDTQTGLLYCNLLSPPSVIWLLLHTPYWNFVIMGRKLFQIATMSHSSLLHPYLAKSTFNTRLLN